MKERLILFFSLVASLAVLYLHLSALKLFYYWKYIWYAPLVHFLTGFAVALLLVYLLISHDRNISSEHLAVTVVSVVFFVAIGWEVFEFANGLTLTPQHYLFDTLKGIAMGVLGSLGALFVAFKIVHRSFRQSQQ